MPTVILLDVSLSMSQPLQIGGKSHEIRSLAIRGLNILLDHLSTHCKLEFVCLIAFSSIWKLITPFTRDLESLKASLANLEIWDKSSLVKAFLGARSVVTKKWGDAPTQVILVTDGGVDVNDPLKTAFETGLDFVALSLPLPLPFPCKLHVLCINDCSTPYVQGCLPLFQKLIDVNKGGGKLFIPNQPLSIYTILKIFRELAKIYYKPFHILHCGHLASYVSLSPPPEVYEKASDFDEITADMSTKITVCGFIDTVDVGSPPSYSRHLVLPIQSVKDGGNSVAHEETLVEGITDKDRKTPNFCALLHGGLKLTGMVAICNLGGDFYGMLHPWAISKNKSNLMLSAFEPGQTIPWLGKFCNMGFEPLEKTVNLSFPVNTKAKKSYAENSVVWIKQMRLLADVQSIMMLARKLPENIEHFYKELNRFRNAALSFGSYEILKAMAEILDREFFILPDSTHPAAAIHLSYCVSELRLSCQQNYDIPIKPLQTQFRVNNWKI